MTNALLADLTVLDFTRVLAGPYCTRLLADLGARVIKVERPVVGDDMRAAPLQLDPARDDQSTYFVRVNAGKLGIALDLAHPEARPIVLDLVRAADVVVENFVPGVMTKLGLDYPALAAVRPDLVYCAISGYGQTGPWRDRPAFAHVIHAVSGLMHLESDGETAPAVAYLQAADILAGTHAFGAILAALRRRDRTGQGAYLDVSMLEALISAEDISFGAVLNGGEAYRGPRRGMLVHRVGDGWVALQIVGAQALWPRLVGLLGRPELTQDPRFATPIGRREHWTALRGEIVRWLEGFRTADEALAALTAALSPARPCSPRPRSPAIPISPPAARSPRSTIRPGDRCASRPPPSRSTAMRWRRRRRRRTRPGEDTRRVLADILGYETTRIHALAQQGAIATPATSEQGGHA